VTFTKNETHVADGLLKFAAPFWGKPRWASLYKAFGLQIQELENVAWDVIESRMLSNANAARLKVLGALVGQHDPGLGIEVFRNLIRVRIRVNRSEGRLGDVIEVLQLLGIPRSNRTITPVYPAKIRVDLSGTMPLPMAPLSQILNDTTAAGVGVIVTWPYAAPGFSFSDNTSVPGPGQVWTDNTYTRIDGNGWTSAFPY
jgi:hypothetical protein